MKNKEIYIDFCKKNQVPLFFKPFWLDIFGTNWQVKYEEGAQVCLFFIYHLEKKMGFKIIRNPYLTPYSGFLTHGESEHQKQELVQKILLHFPNFDELNLDLLPQQEIDFMNAPFEISFKRTNILTLKPPASLFENYKPSLKRQIKKAQKSIQIREADDIQLFFKLHQKTFSKQEQKSHTPFSAFEKVWKTCKQNQCGKLLFAFDSTQNIHAALMLTYDENRAYYLAGGTDAAYYGSGAMSYLMHTAISESFEMGLSHFDFEGSMINGVDRFFKNYSPEEWSYPNIKAMDSSLLKIIKSLRK